MSRDLVPESKGNKKPLGSAEIPYMPVVAEYNEMLGELNRHFNSVDAYITSSPYLLDFSEALTHKVTLGVTGVQFDAAGAKENDTMIIQVTNAADYPASVPAEFHFPNGTAPTFTATAGAIDIITAFYNGTNYMCTIAQDIKITI